MSQTAQHCAQIRAHCAQICVLYDLSCSVSQLVVIVVKIHSCLWLDVVLITPVCVQRLLSVVECTFVQCQHFLVLLDGQVRLSYEVAPANMHHINHQVIIKMGHSRQWTWQPNSQWPRKIYIKLTVKWPQIKEEHEKSNPKPPRKRISNVSSYDCVYVIYNTAQNNKMQTEKTHHFLQPSE